MTNMFNMISQFRQNPMAMLMKRFNIPQNIQSPKDIVQHLLDSGQISQDQLNNAMRMKDNPQFKQFMK